MSLLPPGGACPVDLHYADPQLRMLDLGRIVTRGRRLRRRRLAAHLAAGIIACAAAVSVAIGARSVLTAAGPAAPGRVAQPPVPVDALIATSPPANGKLTLVSTWPQHWITVAWATRGSSVCFAIYRVPAAGTQADVECPAWGPADIPAGGTSGLSPLLPGIEPIAAARGRTIVPEFGLVTTRAVRVVVTFFGRNVSAKVAPVPLPGGKAVGLYLAWVTLPAHNTSYGSADLSRVIGYDASGHVVARHGPWQAEKAGRNQP
jgi:hypothetical protein